MCRRTTRLLISALVLSAALSGTAGAITVTTTADEDNTNPAGCSLREAVIAINTAASYGGCTFVGGDTTVSLGADTYTVSLNGSGRIEISVPMTIAGAGPTSTTIEASSFDDDLLFVDLNVDGTVTLEGVALTGAVGSSFGNNAALFAIAQTDRDLVLQDVTIRDNLPSAVPALNIQGNSSGTVSLTRVVFQNNVATTTQFSGSDGAAMRCSVGDSSSPPSVTMTDVSFIQNSISSAQDFTVPAAGLTSTGCNLDLHNVTFDSNSVSSPNGIPLAGAMLVTDYFGSTTDVSLVNVTFFGNSGGTAGAIDEAIQGSGGGAGFAMTLTNVTFAQNTSSTQGGGDHIYQDNGAGANLRNVLFGPTAGSDCAGNPSPSFTLSGGNMDSDGSCAVETTNPNPGLALALADNGGFTPTLALNPGGAAVDAGVNTGAPPTDQRGQARPQDGDGNGTATSDVGAYELVGSVVTPPSVPTAGPWGLGALVLTLAAVGVAALRLRAHP